MKEPLHVVFKVNRPKLRHGTLRSPIGHALILRIVRKYASRFFVKVEQISIQGDHCHLLVRAPRRSKFHDFFRVVAGQIAQGFEREGLLTGKRTGTPGKRRTSGDLETSGEQGVTDTQTGLRKGTGLWKYRPFTRVVRGWKAYQVVRSYIRLNEKEARGEIPYRKQRLRGLSSAEWEILWS
jgi:REP element-mobilizing transposase RayT